MTFLSDLPQKNFRVIYADPPWRMALGTKSRPQHYERMTFKEICDLPVKNLAHPEGCRLFLWITAPLLNRADEVCRAWGFKYSSVRTWQKLYPGETTLFFDRKHIARGTGYEVVGNAEFLIIAKRGKPQSIKGKPWDSFIIEERREHSRKPDSVRSELTQRLEGPRLEMFARHTWDGWTAWGDQTTRFNEVA